MNCPVCQKNLSQKEEDLNQKYRPFCSARCKDVDLGKWLNEEYRISRPPDEKEQHTLNSLHDEEQNLS